MKVHRDLWNMVYEFATSIKDVKEVNESDGWPVFIDEFV
jgi:fido (protein-threonine AMPylation protein)